jgi:hypothetical protein
MGPQDPQFDRHAEAREKYGDAFVTRTLRDAKEISDRIDREDAEHAAGVEKKRKDRDQEIEDERNV